MKGKTRKLLRIARRLYKCQDADPKGFSVKQQIQLKQCQEELRKRLVKGDPEIPVLVDRG